MKGLIILISLSIVFMAALLLAIYDDTDETDYLG
jgi:hypothetical protein